MNNTKLMSHLRFDETDLQLNRIGKFSEKQKKALQIKEGGAKMGAMFLRASFIIIALLGLSGAAITALNSRDLAFTTLIGVTAGLICLSLWGCASFLAIKQTSAKVETKVKKVEGPINVVKVIHRSYKYGMENYTEHIAYELRIDGNSFNIRPEFANVITQGDVYVVYYADFSLEDKQKEVLSVEFLSKSGILIK